MITAVNSVNRITNAPPATAKCKVPIIYLADHEWGNQLMYQVAMEWFAEHPACQFVEVVEHAGWHLGFRRDGGVWCTANDMAHCKGPFPPPNFEYGPSVRRS